MSREKFYCFDPGEDEEAGAVKEADSAYRAAEMYAADFYPWDDMWGTFNVMVRGDDETEAKEYAVSADVHYSARLVRATRDAQKGTGR